MPESSCDVLGVDDIEDLIGFEDVSHKDRYINKRDVVPKVRKRKTKKSELDLSPSDTIEGNITFIIIYSKNQKTFFFCKLYFIKKQDFKKKSIEKLH